MKVLEKLGFWIIPLVALIIIAMVYWGPSGFYQDMKELGQTVSGYVPNVSIGMNELNASGVAIPANQIGEISGLDRAIKNMLASNNTNCFYTEWGGLKSDIGEGGKSTVINIYYDNNAQAMKIIVANKNGQVYKIFNFNNTRPCVIAGVYGEAKNFYAHYIDGDPLVSPYSSGVQGLTIFHQKEWTSYNGNTVRVVGWPDDGPVNDEGNNFDNGGLLFKGGSNEICFFPTNDEIDADDDGIESDYVKKLKKEATNPCS